jgi:Domain of unknown function (DUF5916)/Carbohydrate family 9 binding domain-like
MGMDCRSASHAFAASLLAAGFACLWAGEAHAGQQVDFRTAHLSRRLVAVRASAPIKIDGVLDEADWQQAPIAKDFIQNEPREGDAATEDTEVRVLYDNQNLYIGVLARDREPQRIIVNDLKKDFTVANSDGFELVLDTFRDERNGYVFSINPAGAKADAQMANEGRETNRSWDGVWTTQSQVTEEGWTAEIAIPFRTLKFTSAETQTWGVNFLRRVRRRNEESLWAPLPRIYDLSRVSMAGTLEGLQGLRPGKDLRLKPYALASMGQKGGASQIGDGALGFDIKYGITSGITWDFTVNTDFAQVEADEQQINLSRFSLFFPEKRDFFLENSGVFQFGTAQGGGGGQGGGRQDSAARNDVILFHSRTIGLSKSGEDIPILGGTRLTGRAGAYSIGALNIQQRAQGAVPDTNFTALRLRRNVLANSDIGVMVLNKDESGLQYNRVIGADANFRFFRNLNVNGSATKTMSPAAVLAPGEGNDSMLRSNFTYRGDLWEFRGSYTTIGDRFNDEMGYVPRVGINKTTAYFSPHMRPKNLPGWLREVWPHWDFSNVTRTGGALDSRYYDYHFPFTFQDGGLAELGFQRSIEGPAVPFTINSTRKIVIPAGEYAFNDWFVTARSNQAAAFSVSGRYGLGDFYDGYRHTYQAGVGLRFGKQLNLTTNYARNAISLPAGEFTTDLVSTRVTYDFSTKMFLNALLQYNTDARQWSSNVRFNIIHRPLSDFFLVYNERRDSVSDHLIDRALIAKMTYMMAF